jgi:hypothetical protein
MQKKIRASTITVIYHDSPSSLRRADYTPVGPCLIELKSREWVIIYEIRHP